MGLSARPAPTGCVPTRRGRQWRPPGEDPAENRGQGDDDGQRALPPGGWGIDRIRPGMRIWVGGQWFYVTGILNPAAYAPEIDSAVLAGFPTAGRYLSFDGHPSEIYVRTTADDQAAATAADNLLADQASPEDPNQVDVSRPSDALTAQADAKGALDTLFPGLGTIALLAGATGVANIMVISVLERRAPPPKTSRATK